jgi:hypothetical protein
MTKKKMMVWMGLVLVMGLVMELVELLPLRL